MFTVPGGGVTVAPAGDNEYERVTCLFDSKLPLASLMVAITVFSSRLFGLLSFMPTITESSLALCQNETGEILTWLDGLLDRCRATSSLPNSPSYPNTSTSQMPPKQSGGVNLMLDADSGVLKLDELTFDTVR